jgi:hypothetical protein
LTGTRASLRVRRGVQRNRQVGHDRFLRQLLEARQDADGGQRDAPGRNGQTLRVRQDADGAQRRVIVVQRLAHAHEHNVEGLAGQAGVLRQDSGLPGDFGGRQVAQQPHLARQAERAAHRAAHLGRDAERLGRRIRDEHGFNLLPIVKPEEELGRPVGGDLAQVERGRGDPERGRQPLPQWLTEVGHVREIRDAARPNPVEDLTAAKAGLAEIRENLLESRQIGVGQVEQACRRVGGGRHLAGKPLRNMLSFLT